MCVPPPAESWASFGASLIIPPARVDNPDRIRVGDRVVVHENVWMSVVRHFRELDTRLDIGDDVRIGRSCQLSVAGEVVIESGAIIGDFVQIGDTFHPYEEEDRLPHLVEPRPVRIGRGAVLASHVIVLPGVTIGAGAYIDHHAVVARDVPVGAVVAGRPAQPRPDR